MAAQPMNPALANPQAILTLARDNKWQDVKALVAAGAPVDFSNPVSAVKPLTCQGTHICNQSVNNGHFDADGSNCTAHCQPLGESGYHQCSCAAGS
jgi:hypothetical protein